MNIMDWFWKIGHESDPDSEPENDTHKEPDYRISFNPNCRCWLVPLPELEPVPPLTDADVDGVKE